MEARRKHRGAAASSDEASPLSGRRCGAPAGARLRVRNNPLLGPRLEKTPFIVGDGEPVAYRLRLTVNGKGVDEAEVAVSFRDGR